MVHKNLNTKAYINKQISFVGRPKQSGFVMGMILAALAVIAIVVAAIAMSSKNDSSKGSPEKDKVNASALIDAATKLQTGFIRYASIDDGYKDLIAKCGHYPGGMANGLCLFMSDSVYNKNLGIMTQVNTPDGAYDPAFLTLIKSVDFTGAPFFLPNKSVFFQLVMGVEKSGGTPRGSTLKFDGELYAFLMTPRLKKSVCQQVEHMLNGKSLDAEPAGAGDNPTVIDTGNKAGCFAVSEGYYMFYSAAFVTPAEEM